MNKKTLSVLIVIFVIVVAGLIWGFGFNNTQEMTYEECVNNYLTEQRYLPYASSEDIGAERIDKDGNYWIKQGEDSWGSSVSPATTWGDLLIDQQPGGKNYNPDVDLYNLPECLIYSDRNLELEEGLTNLIENNLEEGFDIEYVVSSEKNKIIFVDVSIDCSNVDSLNDNGESIIQDLSESLFLNYEEIFAKNKNNYMMVYFSGCGGDWIIKSGTYEEFLEY